MITWKKFCGTAIMLALLLSAASALDSEDSSVNARLAADKIAELLRPGLEREGFVRQGLNWYRYETESILVIEVQPSDFLPGPYINLGIFYFKYGSAEFPDIVDCHLDTGFVSVIPNPLRGNALLDPNSAISLDVRRQELDELIHAHAIPWLQTMGNFSAAKHIIKENPSAAHVAPVAQKDLISPTTDPL